MHKFGIPIILIGKIANYIKLPHVKRLCELEMAARTINKILRIVL